MALDLYLILKSLAFHLGKQNKKGRMPVGFLGVRTWRGRRWGMACGQPAPAGGAAGSSTAAWRRARTRAAHTRARRRGTRTRCTPCSTSHLHTNLPYHKFPELGYKHNITGLDTDPLLFQGLISSWTSLSSREEEDCIRLLLTKPMDQEQKNG